VGDAVGRVFFHGLGAGQMPTASAVVADIVDTVLGRAAITFRTLELWSTKREAPVAIRDPAKVSGRYYLHFSVDDRPGVLAEIAGVLGRHEISIASVIQHEREEVGGRWNVVGGELTPDIPPTTYYLPPPDVVPLVIMTHSATEGAMREAMATIEQLGFVHPRSIRMRVRD
jgi:homoserine dehydrogenase